MARKRINKILWYGDDLADGKALPPPASSASDGLDGLNEGELYISNHPNDPAIFIRTSTGSIVRVGGADAELLKELFLSKVEDDTAKGMITFEKGAKFGNFIPSSNGGAFAQDSEGNWYIETDNLHVRRKATFNSVEIQDVSHVGGQNILTPANATLVYVEDMGDSYRCYFRQQDGEGIAITNDWTEGDQAYCNVFNIDGGSHYYWRLVEGKGNGEGEVIVDGVLTDLSTCYYIDLSKSFVGINSDAPRIGDHVVQLGCRTSRERQNAIVIAGAGTNSPYIYVYTGIDSFMLPEPEIRIKPGDNYFSGKFKIEAGSEVEKPDGGSSTIGGIVDDLDEIKQQTDKRFEMWYNVGEPLPQKDRLDEANSPADEWLDEATKALHVQDLYFDIDIEPASKGGRAWRWEAESTESGENIFYWAEVNDQDTIDALDKIRDVASDGVLTGGSEKGRVLIDWLDAVSSHAKYMEQAADYEDEDSTVVKSAEDFNDAFFALATMLNDGDEYKIEDGVYPVPSWLGDISTSNVIADPEYYRAKWNNFYSTLTALLQTISRITGEKAQQAETDASEAKKNVDDIVSDNKLDPSEKQSILKDFKASWDEMIAEGGILDEAKDEKDNYIIDREVYITPYISAFEKLGNYLDGYDKDDDGGDWEYDNISKTLPSWLQDLTSTNDINGEKFRRLWSEFYQRRTAVLTALSNLANDTANEALENSKGSVKVFVSDSTSEMPEPPYRKGDLWLAGKEEYYCINAKGEEESASMSDWAKLNVSVEEVFSSFVKSWYNKYGGTLDELDINGFYSVHLLINAEESVDAYNGDLIYYSESDSLYYYNGVSYIEVTDGLRNSVGDIFKLVGSMTYRIFADRPNFAVTPDMFDLLIDVNRISYAGVPVTGGFGAYMYMSSGWTLLFEQSKAFFQALSDSIVGIVSGINSQSGVVIKENFASVFAESLEKDEGVKAEIVASITDENGVLSSDISISADKVNITGNDSISMMVKNTAESNWLMYPLGVNTMESASGSRTREVVFDDTFGNVLQITSTEGTNWQAYSPIKDYASYPLSGTKVTVYAVINTDGTPDFNIGIQSNNTLMADTSDYSDLGGNWRLYHKVVTLADYDTLAGIANLYGTIKVYALGVVVGDKTPTIDEIKVQVTEAANLYLTGIDITKGLINLRADRVKFSSSDGSVTDKVWIDPTEGTLHAEDGVFSGNVTATSGYIGGWTISGSHLESNGNDAYLLSKNGDSYVKTGMFSGAHSLLWTLNTKYSSYIKLTSSVSTDIMIGTYYDVKNTSKQGGYQFAFTGQGSGMLKGSIDGYMLGGEILTATTANNGYPAVQIKLMSREGNVGGNRQVFYCGSGINNGAVILPDLTEVLNYLLIGNDYTGYDENGNKIPRPVSPFAIRLTIIAGQHVSTSDVSADKQFLRVLGRTNVDNLDQYNKATVPRLNNNNGGSWTNGIYMCVGDVLELMLVYNGRAYEDFDKYEQVKNDTTHADYETYKNVEFAYQAYIISLTQSH